MVSNIRWGFGALVSMMVFAVFVSVPAECEGGGDGLRPSTLAEYSANPENASYRIEGKAVELIGGRNEVQAAPGSASKITTAVFGSPVSGDLNDDGRPDAALTLYQNTGGTGTFIYTAAAVRHASGYRGTNAVFIGDRIAVDRISIRSGVIVVEYRDREQAEPMSASPSVAKVARYVIQNGELMEISR